MKQQIAEMIRAIDGTIATIEKGARDARGAFADHVANQSARATAGLAGEIDRLVFAGVDLIIAMLVPHANEADRMAFYESEVVRGNIEDFYDDFVRNRIIPGLRKLDLPGDIFTFWMELKRTTKVFGDVYDEIAKAENTFGYLDLTAILAILALAAEAEDYRAQDRQGEAWSKVVEASYWLGTLQGGLIGFSTGTTHGWRSSNTARAQRSADEKNAPNRQLKAFAIRLLYERKPASGWGSIPAAAKDLYPDLEAEWTLINVDLKAANKEPIYVAPGTVEEWFRKLPENEKETLFKSKQPKPSRPDPR